MKGFPPIGDIFYQLINMRDIGFTRSFWFTRREYDKCMFNDQLSLLKLYVRPSIDRCKTVFCAPAMVTTQILQNFINILQTVEYYAAKWRNNGMNVR